MKCAACQTEVDASSVYCPKCGAKLEPEEQNTAETPAEEPVADETQASASVEADGSAESEVQDQGTISDRLREVARTGGEKTSDNDAGTLWTQGGYSPKALNARFLLTCVVSVLLLVFGLWLQIGHEWRPGFSLYPSLAVIAGLWIWFACIRIYRVGTIKYQLTAHQFYHEEGIFKRVRDVVEVIDIDDLKLERTLWDRVINGGVGTVTIQSTDQSSPVLHLKGLDDPDVVFQSLDDARRKERTARGLKSV